MLNIQDLVTKVKPHITSAWHDVDRSRGRMNPVVGQYVKVEGNFTAADMAAIEASSEWAALKEWVTTLPSRYSFKAALSRLEVREGTFAFLVG